MKTQYSEVISSLLKHSDMKSVQQAFQYLDTNGTTLETFLKILQNVLGLDISSNLVPAVRNATQNLTNRTPIIEWIWNKLEGFGVESVVNRERRYILQLKVSQRYNNGERSIPHYRYAEPITKEAYDFWKDRTEKEFFTFFQEWSFENFDDDIYEQYCSSTDVPQFFTQPKNQQGGLYYLDSAGKDFWYGLEPDSYIHLQEIHWSDQKGWVWDDYGPSPWDVLSVMKKIGQLKDFRNVSITNPIEHVLTREDEYFLEWFNPESETLFYSEFSTTSGFDIEKLQFHEGVKPLVGVQVNRVVYDGIDLKIVHCYGDQYGPQRAFVSKGLKVYRLKESN